MLSINSFWKEKNKVTQYFTGKKIQELQTSICSEEEIYFFTHDIFYLSYLNSEPEYFKDLKDSEKEVLMEYIYSYMAYCMVIENIDLLGELLICSILIEGTLYVENIIVQKGLWFIEKYLNNVLNIDFEDIDAVLGVYHTVLVIYMLGEIM